MSYVFFTQKEVFLLDFFSQTFFLCQFFIYICTSFTVYVYKWLVVCYFFYDLKVVPQLETSDQIPHLRIKSSIQMSIIHFVYCFLSCWLYRYSRCNREKNTVHLYRFYEIHKFLILRQISFGWYVTLDLRKRKMKVICPEFILTFNSSWFLNIHV